MMLQILFPILVWTLLFLSPVTFGLSLSTLIYVVVKEKSRKKLIEDSEVDLELAEKKFYDRLNSLEKNVVESANPSLKQKKSLPLPLRPKRTPYGT